MTSYVNSLIGSATTTLSNPVTSVRPATVVSNPGGWSPFGATDLAAVLADESDSSYAQSPVSPSNAAFTVAPPATWLDATKTIVSTRFRVPDAAPSVNVLVELVEVVAGSPVVRSSQTSIATPGWQTVEWTLTSTENTSIVDRTKLEGRITAGV